MKKSSRSSSGEESVVGKKKKKRGSGSEEEGAARPPHHRSISVQDEVLSYGRIWEHPFNAIANDHLPARLVLAGDRRSGTTSLIRQYTLGLFSEQYRPEPAKVMRHTKNVFLPRLKSQVTVQMWDVEGADIKTAMLCAQKAHGVAVVYDMTDRSSFELAQRLLDNINPRASTMLIACKLDLEDSRKVSHEEGRLLAKIHRVEFLETSSKLNYNVEEAMRIFVSSMPDEYLKSSAPSAAARRWHASASAVLCALCQQKLRHPENDESHFRTKRYLSN